TKIGLISHDEFDEYYNILTKLNLGAFWTRTPNSGWGPNSVFYAMTGHPKGTWNSTLANDVRNVVPAMYLFPNIVVEPLSTNANPTYSQISDQSTFIGQ